MGIALIIPNADFSENNLGTVTFLEDVAVTGISITSDASVSGQTFVPTVTYTPATTNQKGVTWEIISGNAYATINSETGVVTILSGASGNNITIKATSTYDVSVTAESTVSVTYVETPVNPTALTISGSSTVTGQSSAYTVTYSPETANQLGVIWSIDSGSSFATINSSTGVVTILSSSNASNVVIRATSTADTNVYATKSLTLTYEVTQIGRKAIFSTPLDDANATAISTVNPISEKYWNSLKACTSAYHSDTIKDVNNLSWFNTVLQSDSVAQGLITSYLTNNYSTIKDQGLGDTGILNKYTEMSGLINNTGYSTPFFANCFIGVGYSNVSGTFVYPKLWITNIPNGTYKFKFYITAIGDTATNHVTFNSAIFWGVNANKTYLPNSEPENYLNSPTEVEVTITDNKAVVFYGTTDSIGNILGSAGSGKSWIYRLQMLEIERTA